MTTVKFSTDKTDKFALNNMPAVGNHRLMFFTAIYRENMNVYGADSMLDIGTIEKKLKMRETQPIGKHNFFSVVIPICRGKIIGAFQEGKDCKYIAGGDDEDLNILFEVRSDKLKNQPGDICFPGGRIEAGETPVKAALREFEEETGIPASDVRIIAPFDTLYGFDNYTVYTFVAEIKESSLTKINVNKEEVEEFFTVPLEFFKGNPPKVYEADIVSDVAAFPYAETGISPSYKWRKSKNIIPVYHWENRVIWGMTARIVKWFTDKIL